MVWIKLIAQILNVALIVCIFYLLAESGLPIYPKEILFFTAIFLLLSFNLLALYGSGTDTAKKYTLRTLLVGAACCVLILTYQYASQLQFNRSILPTAEKILAKDGKAIAELAGRPASAAQGISFKVDDTKDYTHFDGNTLVINSYFGKKRTNLERIIVLKLVEKIQNSHIHAAHSWMQSGLAHFVYYKLGYGTLYPGYYYHYMGDGYGAANFFNWLYERPDNKKTYHAIIKDMNAGIKPRSLDALLEKYYDAMRAKAEQQKQADKK
jgi:hypothetical protein